MNYLRNLYNMANLKASATETSWLICSIPRTLYVAIMERIFADFINTFEVFYIIWLFVENEEKSHAQVYRYLGMLDILLSARISYLYTYLGTRFEIETSCQ
jgi:hypothetical protein